MQHSTCHLVAYWSLQWVCQEDWSCRYTSWISAQYHAFERLLFWLQTSHKKTLSTWSMLLSENTQLLLQVTALNVVSENSKHNIFQFVHLTGHCVQLIGTAGRLTIAAALRINPSPFSTIYVNTFQVSILCSASILYPKCSYWLCLKYSQR